MFNIHFISIFISIHSSICFKSTTTSLAILRISFFSSFESFSIGFVIAFTSRKYSLVKLSLLDQLGCFFSQSCKTRLCLAATAVIAPCSLFLFPFSRLSSVAEYRSRIVTTTLIAPQQDENHSIVPQHWHHSTI